MDKLHCRDLQGTCKEGISLTHWIRSEQVQVAEYILQRGADPNLADING